MNEFKEQNNRKYLSLRAIHLKTKHKTRFLQEYYINYNKISRKSLSRRINTIHKWNRDQPFVLFVWCLLDFPFLPKHLQYGKQRKKDRKKNTG